MDLRDVDSAGLTSLASQSAVQFATQIAGNIDAPLANQTIWMQGAGDEIEWEDEDSQEIYSHEDDTSNDKGIFEFCLYFTSIVQSFFQIMPWIYQTKMKLFIVKITQRMSVHLWLSTKMNHSIYCVLCLP